MAGALRGENRRIAVAHITHAVCSAAGAPCGNTHKSPAIARAYALSLELVNASTPEEKQRAYRLMRASLLSAFPAKRDGTHPLLNAPLELEVI